MRRFARHMFTVGSALSLLLLIATCTLWVRSNWCSDHLFWWSPNGYYVLGTARGHFTVQLNPGDVSGHSTKQHRMEYKRMSTWAAPSSAQAYNYLNPAVRFSTYELAGMGLYIVHGRSSMSSVTGVLPFWIVAASSAVLPVGWTVQWFRSRRRRKVGVCATCGYDLRATPDRCPECGTAATPES
jgi:hypothetical protein